MNEFKSALELYLKMLTEYGSGAPSVLKEADSMESILKLNELKKVELPAELIIYLQKIDGYDPVKESKLDIPNEIARGMAAMNLKECYNEAINFAGFDSEDDIYWPLGFVPILSNYGGDYIVVNCIRESPTYGAVYDFTEGVGVNLLAYSLNDFLECSTKELTSGFRIFKHDDEDYEFQSITVKGFDEESEIYGNTPYFQRRGKMDTQIVDWV